MIGERRSLGADLMLIRQDERALIIECKYSSDTGVVGQRGYEQALAYATEARTSLVPEVMAVVGPQEVVPEPAFVDTIVGTVGVIPPHTLSTMVVDSLDT